MDLYLEMKDELEMNLQSSLIRLCDQTENMLFVTFTPYLVKVCLRTIKKRAKMETQLILMNLTRIE